MAIKMAFFWWVNSGLLKWRFSGVSIVAIKIKFSVHSRSPGSYVDFKYRGGSQCFHHLSRGLVSANAFNLTECKNWPSIILKIKLQDTHLIVILTVQLQKLM